MDYETVGVGTRGNSLTGRVPIGQMSLSYVTRTDTRKVFVSLVTSRCGVGGGSDPAIQRRDQWGLSPWCFTSFWRYGI